MSALKTVKRNGDVKMFIDQLTDEQKRSDSHTLLDWMEKITSTKAAMWGKDIIGFGTYRYAYKSGREGEWFLTGFGPRKNALSIYILDGFENHAEHLEKLGKYKTGKGCLYVTRLAHIDTDVLQAIIRNSFRSMLEKHQGSLG